MNERQQQLIELAAERPDLADTVSLYQDIVEAQTHYATSRPSLPPTPAAVLAQIDAGRPVAPLCAECFDWPAISSLACDICSIVARHRPELQEDLQVLRNWLSEEGSQVLPIHLFGNEIPVPDLQDMSLIVFVLNYAFYPWLHDLAQALGSLPTYEHWHRGDCPLCGASPDLAYLAPESGRRHLICARCDTDWEFQRLGCPFCGEVEEGQRHFVDEQTGRRLYRCDSCGRYLKTIDRRIFWRRYTPLVERLRTLDMDMMARSVVRGA